MKVPKNFINTFKTILKEAADLFDKPMSLVSIEQFQSVCKGRLSFTVVRVFGYARLRNCVAPSANTTKAEIQEVRKLIAKLVKSA